MTISSGILQFANLALPTCLLLVVGSLSAADATNDASPDTLTVVARLVEIPGKFPPNDLYNYVYIMKYRILKVEKGNFKDSEILVGHYNPLIGRKQIKDKMDPLVDGDVTSFTKGEKHRLVLVAPIETVWNDAVEDEYIDSEAEKYYALRCDRIK